jgi:hypothetical protein
MRFWIAVAAAALAQLFIYVRLAGWVQTGALLAVAYIAFSSLGAGWFAGRRAALAGALSVVFGVALYGVVTFFGPAAIGMGTVDLILGELRLIIAYWPYALLGAAAGATGGWLHRRATRRRR